MDSRDASTIVEPKTPEERIVWVLDQLIRSSKIRGDYFKHINDFYSKYITTNIEPDPTTGIMAKNKEMYDAIHADFIFRVLGVIESFQGAMAAAWRFTAPGKRNLDEILSILIDPRGHRGNIVNRLRKEAFTEKTICRMFAFPIIARLEKREKKIADKLRTLLNDVFQRIMDCAWYSQCILDEYEDIRNVYAHNFRFIFIEHIETDWRVSGDESILGFLKNPTDLSEGMVFIGDIQRVVMADMVFLILELERWIYNNLKVTVLNKCKPVLPPYIPYLTGKHREEYEEIWKARGYSYYGPPLVVKGPIKVDRQILLVIDLLGKLDEWERPLRVYGKDGKEFRFPVKKVQHELKKRLDEIESKMNKGS
ncbi:MAG: hypothetical protein ACW99U_17960 [Candidatus Thorarchaeota archaeon]|jgi:hypothetical protein